MTNQPEAARILCIEDDLEFAGLLTLNLERAGYQVTLAEDGSKGVQLAIRSDFQLVLLNYDLPEMAGSDVIEILTGRNDHPPIVLLSALNDKSRVFKAIKQGAEDYLLKGSQESDFQLLQATVKRVLEKRRLLAAKRATEQAFFRQNEILRKIIDNIPCGIFWKDVNSVYQGCNEHFRQQTNLQNCDDIINLTDQDLHFTKEEAIVYAENDRTILSTGKAMLNVEVPSVLPNEEKVWLMSKVPLEGNQNRPIGVVGIIWDITERKLMEQANIKYGFKLQEKVMQLKRKNQEIKKAQKRLISQEKLASMGAMTAGIAHEIRNPLNFIQNLSSLSVEYLDELGNLLQRAGENLAPGLHDELVQLVSDLRSNGEVIQKHGARAAHVVKSMAELGNAGVGVPDRVNPNTLVAEYLELVQGMRDYQGMTYQCDYDPHLEQVEVVSRNLGRALINLFNNAYDALLEKSQQADFEPCLQVTTSQADDQVVIRIRDNGGGIAEEIMERIFEPFYTTKASGQGNIGLGLSLCHEIVEVEHGGRLTVDSQLGEYTEFSIYLHHFMPHSN